MARTVLVLLWAGPGVPPFGAWGPVRVGVLLVLLPYVIGSIPFGVLLARAFSGVDVRTVGSHNIGATNVVRAAGKTAGVLTLILDALKGALPTLAARAWLGLVPGCLVGLCAFLGHLFPIFLKGKGGKGVATALGVFAVLAPWAALVGLVTYGAVLGLTRVSALGSLSGAGAVLAAAALLRYPREVLILCAAIDLLILWRHRSNLAQLARRRG